MKRQLLTLGITSLVSIAVHAQDIPQVHIAVTDKKCEPMNLEVPTGKVQFIIKNKSMRALEWEILNGVMVVAERENIAPGFYQKMTVNLEAGQYQTTCGLLTNPHGTLTVSGEHEYRIKAQDLIAIAAEYKFYLILQTRQLQKWLDGDATSVSDSVKQAYYSVKTMLPAYGQPRPKDYLQPMARAQLKQQVTAWQTLVRQKTLSLMQLNTQLSDMLLQNISDDGQSQGIDANVMKWVDVVTPLAKKIDAQTAQALTDQMQSWHEHPDKTHQQAFRKQIRQFMQRLQQENES